MALDSERKRAAAITVGVTGTAPSMRPDGSITAFDRWQSAWSYKAAADGTITFYFTTLEGGVDTNVYDGVTMDDSFNLRVRGDIYEGSAT